MSAIWILILKVFGLLFSGVLTASLFVRLFGNGAYGIAMAVSSLILFEGGAFVWERQLAHSKGKQRLVNYIGLWFCALVSVVSSSAEIIMATHLWDPGFDLGFVTLVIISVALAVNVLGALAMTQLDPDRLEKNRELDRKAREAEAMQALEDEIVTASIAKVKENQKSDVARVSNTVSQRIQRGAVERILGEGEEMPPMPAPAAGGGFSMPQMPQEGIPMADILKNDELRKAWFLYKAQNNLPFTTEELQYLAENQSATNSKANATNNPKGKAA